MKLKPAQSFANIGIDSNMFKYFAIILFFANPVHLQNVNYNCENTDGSKGLCKQYEYCQSAIFMQRFMGKLPTICGHLNNPNGPLVVCCTDINQYLKREISNFYFPGMEVSETKCMEYIRERQRLKNIQNELQSATSVRCGSKTIINVNSNNICYILHFILGGMRADIDEFPHMALLGWEKVNGKGYDWKCGGSLISEEYILTAAHCLFADESELKTDEPTMIRLGGSRPKELKIASRIAHPDYKPPKKYNDIALIKLEKPIEFTMEIFPACLWNKPQVQGTATTIGFGFTSSDGNKAEELQKVSLDIYDDQLCKAGYPASRAQPSGIQNSQFCAGYKLGGRDACQGDSGGPIQTVKEKYYDIFDVIGITSFGVGCGSTKGGVYTRVSSYMNWIEKIVWPNDMKF